MGQITVGTAAVDVLLSDAARKTVSFFNSSTGGQIIYLAKQKAQGLAIANSEYPLPPNGAIDFDIFTDGEDIRDGWSAIASAVGGLLTYSTTSERPSLTPKERE